MAIIRGHLACPGLRGAAMSRKRYTLDCAIERLKASRAIVVLWAAGRFWVGYDGALCPFADLESARMAYLELRDRAP